MPQIVATIACSIKFHCILCAKMIQNNFQRLSLAQDNIEVDNNSLTICDETFA